MDAQTVINQTSIDIRSVLSTAGADANTILGWVDRIQKDVLHRSAIYTKFNQQLTSFSTSTGSSIYTLAPNLPMRHVTQVYDRTFSRPLLDAVYAVAPMYLGSGANVPQQLIEEQVRTRGNLYEKLQAPFPVYFRYIAPSTLILFPAPQSQWVGTMEVYSDILVTTLASTTDILTVPDDGLDVMAAGTNWLANQFLQRETVAMQWLQEYEKLIKGADLS